VLLREAALVLAQAIVGGEGTPADLHTSRRMTLDRLTDTLARAGLRSPVELGRQRALLVNDDPCAADALDLEQREGAADDLEVSTEWLARTLQAPPATDARRQRALRCAAVGVVVLGVSASAWARFAKPRNLALHREVQASSEGFSTRATGAVDGIRYGQLGFHSAEQMEPWLSIDLGREYAIARVAAYGRADCCFDQSVPLAFEVSDDGVTYRPAARREDPFSQADPWIVKPERLTTRFVRFRTLRRSFLVLSEVEVYGHAP
jgi:hypothetical protein